jgi:hypothetical protein
LKIPDSVGSLVKLGILTSYSFLIPMYDYCFGMRYKVAFQDHESPKRYLTRSPIKCIFLSAMHYLFMPIKIILIGYISSVFSFGDEEQDPLFTGERTVKYHGGHVYSVIMLLLLIRIENVYRDFTWIISNFPLFCDKMKIQKFVLKLSSKNAHSKFILIFSSQIICYILVLNQVLRCHPRR